MNNMTIDVLEPVFDPVQNRYKLIAKATIFAVEFIDKSELTGAKFKAQAVLAGAKEKAIAKVLITVVEAAEKIRVNMPQPPKGDTNGSNDGNTNNG